MTYLLSQLWFCLLLAWMLGNIVGWLLRGGCSEHIKRVEKNWRERYLDLENEKEGYRVKLKKYTEADQEKSRLIEQIQRFQGIEAANSKLKARVKQIESKAIALHGEAKTRGQGLLSLQDSVTASKKIINSKDRDLKSLADKLRVSVGQINSFKSQYQEVKGKYESKISQQGVHLQELKQQLDAANEKVSKSSLAKVQQEQAQNTQVSTEAIKELESKTQLLEKSNKENAHLTKKMAEGEARMDILAAEFSKMASQLMQAKAEAAKMKAAVADEQGQDTDALNSAHSNAKDSKHVESSKSSQEGQTELAEELEETTKRLNNYKQLLEKSDTANANLTKKMEGGEKRMDILAAEFSKMASQLMQANVEVNRLKESTTDDSSQKSLKTVEGGSKDLTAELKKERKKSSAQEKKINDLSKKLDKSRSKLVDAHKILQEKSSVENATSSIAVQPLITGEGSGETKTTINEKGPNGENFNPDLLTGLEQNKLEAKALEIKPVDNDEQIQRLEKEIQQSRKIADQANQADDVKEESLQSLAGHRPSAKMNLLRGEVGRGTEDTQEEFIPVNCEIEEIRGIGPGYGMRLRKLGISTNQDLLQKISSDKDIRSIAKKLSRKPAEILSWRKMADFLTIEGMSSEFAKLLELSNVSSAEELAQSNTTALAGKMAAAKKKERRIHNTPDTEEIGEWISNAKRMNAR